MKASDVLFDLILRGDVNGLTELINAEPIDLNKATKDKRTVLYDAIVSGHKEVVSLLIQRGAKVNISDSSGKTPLHFAAIHYRIEIGKALIDEGAKIDAEDKDGNTPLSDAVFYSNGKVEFIKLLLNHGADPAHANKHNVSPKVLAKMISNFDVSNLF